MFASWRTRKKLETSEKWWKEIPKTSGIYVIRRKRAIKRLRGTDPNGILYIGRSSNLQRRLKHFWEGYHTASGFLWDDFKIASRIFERKPSGESDIQKLLGALSVKYAAPMGKTQYKVNRAERAVLYAYIYRFGEAPPLNLSIPKRWKKPPVADDLIWARRGLK